MMVPDNKLYSSHENDSNRTNNLATILSLVVRPIAMAFLPALKLYTFVLFSEIIYI